VQIRVVHGSILCDPIQPNPWTTLVQIVQLMPLHFQTPSSLASFKSRLVLPFWYQLTQVVLEKRPLNGCNVVVFITQQDI